MSGSHLQPHKFPYRIPSLIGGFVLLIGIIGPSAVNQMGVTIWWNPLYGSLLGSLFAIPYGIILGTVTVPLLHRTGIGYLGDTGSESSNRSVAHVIASTFYAVISSIMTGITLLTISSTVDKPWSIKWIAILSGALLLPILFFTLHSLAHPREEERDRRKFIAVLIVYSAALFPAPFTVLLLLDVIAP